MSEVVSLQDIGVSYRNRQGLFRAPKITWALKDVTMSIHAGESLGVIGRNGSGKSTLLQILADIIQPDLGVANRKPGITAALLALRLGFLPHLTGRENAYLSGMFLGIRKSDIDERMESIVEFSGLGAFFEDPIYTYSTGMKMRLAFSVSYQFEPDVLLLDELLGVGDASFKAKSTKVMRERIRSSATVVMVSHNTRRIQDLCDRVIWIDQGAVMAQGTPGEVIPEYAKFVESLKKAGKEQVR